MKTYLRFLEYIKINTKSDPRSGRHPSTEIQKDLARVLVQELKDLGIEAEMDEKSYVYAKIPANSKRKIPTLAFIAHLDTSPDFSGENVKARVISDYDGNDVILNPKQGIVMKITDFPFLKSLKGQSLIVTDGTTLLGADDKAGIAEIMTMAEYLVKNEIEHGEIKIVFTPDEEIGEGPLYYNLEKGGADLAYTVDGGKEGMINYENFNAAAAKITINGINIHPGTAKNVMKNSLLIAMEFNGLLPHWMTPATTEGYEGFYHLNNLNGDVEKTKMQYLIRNHDMDSFRKQKNFLLKARDFLNQKYGPNTVEVEITDTYYNMKEIIKDRMEVVELAIEATKMAGLEPIILPIRGGTDGAQLTYKGLLCPNLGTGGWNAHGRYECITKEAMDKCSEVLLNIVQLVTKKARI
ncbi:MAG TPA: peptidase T [Acholeplasmataceae bacterium]|jgi:tripeptide aminopeptidase|nr:peptidase T [Acholeplasmataceae bacterium]